MVDLSWIKNEYVPLVRNRGNSIIEMRKYRAAGSQAQACIDQVHDWVFGNPNWHCMSVLTDGTAYDIPKGYFYSFPF